MNDFFVSYAVGGNTARFLKVTIADNREFYREILSEFLNFQIQSAQGRHTGAFVFLYRVLERFSYSIPLLYASTQSDYVGTFRDLKAILSEDLEGELGLFKKFLSQGKFIDRLKLQVSQKIVFSSTSGHDLKYFQVSKKLFNKFSSDDQSKREVEIRFEDIPEFLKTVRNRFFHSRTGDGRNNITTIEMPDSDEYFGCINQIVMSFLAIAVLHTFSSKYHV